MATAHLSTELIDAACEGDIERIRQLAAAGHDLNLIDADEGEDLLWFLIWQGSDPAKVRQLLDLGCKPSNQSCVGGTPLVAAVWSREPDVVRLLLEAGADPNIIAGLGDDEMTALDAAHMESYVCDTPEEIQAMEKIEALIRAAGGKTSSA